MYCHQFFLQLLQMRTRRPVNHRETEISTTAPWKATRTLSRLKPVTAPRPIIRDCLPAGNAAWDAIERQQSHALLRDRSFQVSTVRSRHDSWNRVQDVRRRRVLLLPLAEDQSTRVAALVQWATAGFNFTMPPAQAASFQPARRAASRCRHHLVVVGSRLASLPC